MASYNQPTHSILLLELVRLNLNYPINQFASLTFRWVSPRFFAIACPAANFLPFYYVSGIGMPGLLWRWLLTFSALIGPVRKICFIVRWFRSRNARVAVLRIHSSFSGRKNVTSNTLPLANVCYNQTPFTLI